MQVVIFSAFECWEYFYELSDITVVFTLLILFIRLLFT